MKRFLVPGIPFALSLVLSLCTVGTTVGWQDSGFFLAGVKELGVLYPPGFVLYLLLCKAWTLLLGFLDFTLAVHLFSSLCAALAAAAIAVASRDLLRMLGSENDPAATVAGCLAASGYTLWSSALLAKSYALLYLILAVLIWRMIRAAETKSGRDFTIVAALIGTAWAAHPSATTLGAAFLLFVAAHRGTLGAKGIAWRTGVAAACAIGPSLLLPVLAMRKSETMFGDPSTVGLWFKYLLGGAFTSRPGTFGLESWRVVHALTYLWGDFLVVGLASALIGLSRLALVNRGLLLILAAWTLPAAFVATLFRIEGQQDLWLVAAWLPLHLAVAVGLSRIPPRFAKIATASLGIAGVAWAIAVNGRDVSTRGYTLAEQFGRFHLENVEPNAILLLQSDDAIATTRYLQIVKGVRQDVLIVDRERLQSGLYRDLPEKVGQAFAQAPPRPVYYEVAPATEPTAMPAGPLMRRVAPGETVEPKEWPFPVRLAEIPARRERGIRLRIESDGLVVEPEAYEHRWVSLFVRVQGRLGHASFKRGDYERAAACFEAARKADPDRPDAELFHLEGVCRYLLNDFARAEPLLKSSLRMGLTSRQRVRACTYLSAICKKQGRSDEALRYQEQAMGVVGADPELRREFDQFNRPR
jgi:tetratricopeptide (TPR) repeat protein